MLINFRLGSFPAEYKTITSVPRRSAAIEPAIGQQEEPPVNCLANQFVSAGSALILPFFGCAARANRFEICIYPVQRQDPRKSLADVGQRGAPVFSPADAPPQESFLGYDAATRNATSKKTFLQGIQQLMP